MDKAESQSIPANSEQMLVSKRAASEEANGSPDSKRIKIESKKAGAQPPAVPSRIPFPEKV